MDEWRPIPVYPLYEVSAEGRVRSLDRTRRTKTRWGGMRSLRIRGRELRGSQRLGYVTIAVSASREEYVHRLVALAFLGAPALGAEVNHRNGDKSDNRVSNLEWVSHGENMRHAREVLKIRQWSKVSAADVEQIRAMIAAGRLHREVAAQFGISRVRVTHLANHPAVRK